MLAFYFYFTVINRKSIQLRSACLENNYKDAVWVKIIYIEMKLENRHCLHWFRCLGDEERQYDTDFKSVSPILDSFAGIFWSLLATRFIGTM